MYNDNDNENDNDMIMLNKSDMIIMIRFVITIRQ